MERRTIIYYHLPVDNDDVKHPNAFVIYKKSDEIKLKDILDEFPLPGKYHFRFKYRIENNEDVWMDITDVNSSVPTINSKIITKVLRVSWLHSGIQSTSDSATSIHQDISSKEEGRCTTSELFLNGETSKNGSQNQDGGNRITVKPSVNEKKGGDDFLKMFDNIPPSNPAVSPQKDDLDFIFT